MSKVEGKTGKNESKNGKIDARVKLISETLPKKYYHQFYFFGDMAVKIRQHFEKLILVDINHSNKDKCPLNSSCTSATYNYTALAQQITVSLNCVDRYKDILTMLQTEEALKVLLVLLFRGFGWRNEIYETFNISSNLYVQNTLGTLQKLSLLTKEKGFELNPIFFEALGGSKDVTLRKQLAQANLFFISPDFIQLCSLLTGLFEFKCRTSHSFRISLSRILHHCQIFSTRLDQIIDSELTENVRFHICDGYIYETATIKSRYLDRQILENRADVQYEKLLSKKNGNTLTTQESRQLELVNAQGGPLALLSEVDFDSDIKKFKKTKRSITTYNGVECDEQKLMADLKERDEAIENAALEIGNLDKNDLRNRKNQSNNYKPIDLDEEFAKVDALINLIKFKKKIPWDKVQRNIRSNETYNKFLDKCARNNIKTDQEYFFVDENPKTAVEEADDIFNNLGDIS